MNDLNKQQKQDIYGDSMPPPRTDELRSSGAPSPIVARILVSIVVTFLLVGAGILLPNLTHPSLTPGQVCDRKQADTLAEKDIQVEGYFKLKDTVSCGSGICSLPMYEKPFGNGPSIELNMMILRAKDEKFLVSELELGRRQILENAKYRAVGTLTRNDRFCSLTSLGVEFVEITALTPTPKATTP